MAPVRITSSKDFSDVPQHHRRPEPRGGKGTSIIVNNLCFWPGSAVVIDPKGENATVTAATLINYLAVLPPIAVLLYRFFPASSAEMKINIGAGGVTMA